MILIWSVSTCIRASLPDRPGRQTEPTTGLHFADIHNLLGVLNRLADLGNTVLVIEHNLDVIKCADWLIDMGPEGGDGGGTVVAEGPPEVIADAKGSHTGEHLKPRLEDPTAPPIALPKRAGQRSA